MLVRALPPRVFANGWASWTRRNLGPTGILCQDVLTGSAQDNSAIYLASPLHASRASLVSGRVVF